MLYPIQNEIRNKLDLSGVWDFAADPHETGEAQGWAHGVPAPRPMAVPGSWNEQYEDLKNFLGMGWYVKRTYVPQTWRGQRVFMRVGSANYAAVVYVNGLEVGAHEGGHLPFAFEISEHVRWEAENVIAIQVENHLKPTRVPSGNMASAFSAMASALPTTFDFFPFCGLHRPVVLYSAPDTHIADVTVVTDFEGAEGQVRVQVKLNSAQTVMGTARLSEAGAAYEAKFDFQDGVAETILTVPDARLWSDQDPFLYDLDLHAGEDHYTLKVGIRTIAVKDGQVLLNGRPVHMNGFGRHEDFIASGRGLNLPLMVKDYQLMRWTGANSFRTSHYPYSEEEMQMADRQGFLVIDEIPAVSLQFDNEENMAERMRICRQQIEELVARDKNHPSVVMWCVANEPMPRNVGLAGAGSAANAPDPAEAPGKRFLEALMQQARELDPTRLVTLVGMIGGPLSWLEQCDVLCINRYWGWYMLGGQMDTAIAGLEYELDGLWKQFGKPIMMTEFGADTVAGVHGLPGEMWTEEYQAEFIRRHLETTARKPYVAGMQVWNFADFAAVQSIMRVGGLNMKGVFTRTRQPKMAAHVLHEFWNRKKAENSSND